MESSVHDIASYFLWLDSEQEGDGISNLKMQKLVYYAQGFHLALFGAPLFDEPIEAWEHGPVVPKLYEAYKQHRRASIPMPAGFERECLAEDVRTLIDEVFDIYGRYSAWHLRDMTHDEPPWREHYSEDRSADRTIPTSSLKRYFKTQVQSA